MPPFPGISIIRRLKALRLVMTDDLSHLFDEIQQLLAAPTGGADAPALARLEDTLTSGYAKALELEAERWRIERRMSEVAAQLRDERGLLRTDEIASLASRLSVADGELSRLRGLLESLRTRASDLRLAESRV
jgi:hypothetical protein